MISFLGNFRTVYDTDDAKANLIIDHTCIRRSIEGNVNTANFPTAKIGYIGTNKFNESYKDGYLADADEYVHKALWQSFRMGCTSHRRRRQGAGCP